VLLWSQARPQIEAQKKSIKIQPSSSISHRGSGRGSNVCVYFFESKISASNYNKNHSTYISWCDNTLCKCTLQGLLMSKIICLTNVTKRSSR